MNCKIKAVINAQIVLETGILWDSIILICDGKILAYGNKYELNIPKGSEIIDADGAYVGPGFVDIHVHNLSGFSTYEDSENAAKICLKHGTTSFLATPSYTLNKEQLVQAIKSVKENINLVKTMKGIYFEGPYINPKFGAFSHKNPWQHSISKEDFQVFVDEAGDLAKVWTIAPERPGILDFVEYARSVNPNVIFSVGHSEATPSQIRALGKYRPKILTHAMNATGRINVPGGTRGYGPDEYCMQENDMYAELISDSCGIHVHPDLQKNLIHSKGAGRVILITDSTFYDNDPPENMSHVKDLNFDTNGELAGSKLTMNQACKNIMMSTTCGISQAFIMASTNPAKAIGIYDEVGSIEVGKKADLVFVDDKFNVKKVILDGNVCEF